MDRFKAAVDLYTCSIRALEQRSMAFLIVQSLLVAGYVTLLARFNAEWGVIAVIIAMGIIFCIAFFIAGRTTSIDVSAWRLECTLMIGQKELGESGRVLHYSVE